MSTNQKKAAIHDLGGQSRFICQPVDREKTKPIDDFGRRVDALRIVLGGEKLVATDEHRRGVESLSPSDYDNMDYYERWLHSFCIILNEKGVISEDDLK